MHTSERMGFMDGIKVLFAVAFSVSIFVSSAGGESINYCNDPEARLEWERLITKYPHDKDILILHALRLGLCLKVERDDITLDDAIDMFEQARRSLIRQKEREEIKRLKKNRESL